LNLKSDLNKINSLEQLRNYIKEKYDSQELIGISLKKLIGSIKWSVQNYTEKRNQLKYINTVISKNFKLFEDSKDIYFVFDYNGEKRMQLRSFSSRMTGWQGEIKGKNANMGKIGGGVIQRYAQKYLKAKVTPQSNVPKSVQNLDEKFLKKFYFYAKELGYNISWDDFVKKAEKMNETKNGQGYMYSKYLGLEIAYFVKQSPINKVEEFLNDVVGYASSNTSESAVFVKMY
jgi:hypothetical protein